MQINFNCDVKREIRRRKWVAG